MFTVGIELKEKNNNNNNNSTHLKMLGRHKVIFQQILNS